MLVDFSGSMDVAEKRAAAHESAFHLLSWLSAGQDEVSLYAFDREIMELQPPAPSPADVLKKLDSLKPTMEAQRAQMKQLRQAVMDKIRNILTADQRAQLDALKAQHESRRDQK